MKVIEKVWKELRTVKEIGRGAYGNVYKCTNTDTQESFAVKVISVPNAQDGLTELNSEKLSREETQAYYKEIADDLVKEIEILKSLKGTDNIVEIYDAQVVEKELGVGWYILIKMELLTEFKKYSADREFTEADVLKLGADLCSALSVCHKAKIIHRDIKPENIFVDKEGNFKLGDFGVAKQMEKTQGSMSIKGTFNYMSPEVFAGKKCDGRADVYSLAIVMYKLLNNNRLPFIDKNKETIRYSERQNAFERRIKGDNIPFIPGVSNEINIVILKACAFNNIDRYRSAEEFGEQIQQIIDGKKIKKSVKKSLVKKMVAAVAVVSVLATAGLVLWIDSNKIEPDSEDESVYIADDIGHGFIAVTPNDISEKSVDSKYLYADDEGLFIVDASKGKGIAKLITNSFCNAIFDDKFVCWFDPVENNFYKYYIGSGGTTSINRANDDSPYNEKSASLVYLDYSLAQKIYYVVNVDIDDDGKADRQELHSQYSTFAYNVVDYIKCFDDYIVFADEKNKENKSYKLKYLKLDNSFDFDDGYKTNISESWINKDDTVFYKNNCIWFLEKNADEDIVVSKYNFASGGNPEEQVNLSALGIESADSVVTLNDKYVMIEEDEGRYSLVILEEARKVSVKKYRKLGELVDIFVDPDLSSRIVMTYLDEESYYFYSVNEKGHYEFIGKTEEAERVKGLVYKIDKESNEFEKIEIRRNNNGTQDIES